LKNVLITNFGISKYSGSEINAITIAKRMKELGYKVYVAALNFSAPLYNESKEYIDVCINLKKDEFNFEEIEFDLIWAHHFFLLDWLIFDKKVKVKKVIYSSLSGKEYFEAAPIYGNSLNLILANSPETQAYLQEEGLKSVQLLENYSFEEYFNRDIEINKLRKIAVVSNHVPEEVKIALNLLKEKGYEVEIYGEEGKQELITDKVLENYDVIITIGKTVQYCMSLKIPVYVYDRFGGAGYLKMDNMEQNRKHNFSGRSYEKKSEEELVNDIINDFPNAIKDLEQIKQYAYKNFCFEKNVDKLIEQIEKMEPVDLRQIREENKQYSRNLLASKNLVIYMEAIKEKEKDQVAHEYVESCKQKDDTINKYDKELTELTERYLRLEKELEFINNSKIGKVAKKIIKIVRRTK